MSWDINIIGWYLCVQWNEPINGLKFPATGPKKTTTFRQGLLFLVIMQTFPIFSSMNSLDFYKQSKMLWKRVQTKITFLHHCIRTGLDIHMISSSTAPPCGIPASMCITY